LGGGNLRDVLSEGLRAAGTFQSSHYRGQVLAILAPRLSNDLLHEAVVLAGASDDRDEQIRLLATLSQALAALGEYDTAMRVITPHRETFWGSTALADIFAQMPPHLRPAADDRLSPNDHPWQHLHQIMTLLPSLAADQREGLLSQAIAALADIDGHWQTLALARLAPFLSAAQLRAALAHAHTIAVPPFHHEALELLVPELVRHGLAEQAVAIVGQVGSVGGYLALAPLLPEPERRGFFEEAYRAAQAVSGAWRKAEALAIVGAALPYDHQGAILAEAVAAAHSTEPAWRSEALAVVAALLPERERLPLLDAAVQALPAAAQKGRALERLRPQLDATLAAAALALADTFHTPEQLEATTILIDQLPVTAYEDLLDTILDSVCAGEYAAEESLRRLAASFAARDPADLYPFWTKTLHRLATLPRRDFLRGLETAVPMMTALGGSMALVGVAKDIANLDLA